MLSPQNHLTFPQYSYRAFSLFFITLVLLIGTMSRWIDPAYRRDLLPHPDTVEYTATALNLLEHGQFVVMINGVEYPSRYSIGFPLLLMPFYTLFGHQHSNAVYASLSLSLAQIIIIFILSKRLHGGIAPFVATIIILLSPVDVFLATEIMSDVASTVFLLVSLLCLTFVQNIDRLKTHRNHLHQNIVWLILGGLSFGYACLIRQINIVYLPVYMLFSALLIYPVYGSLRQPGHYIRKIAWRLALFLISWVLIQGIALLYNWATFGAPLRTGYHYWIPYWYENGLTFSPTYAFGESGNAIEYYRMMLGEPGRSIYGDLIALFPSFIIVFVGIGLVSALVNGRRSVIKPYKEKTQNSPIDSQARKMDLSFALWAIEITGITFVIYSLYFFRADTRFLHLVLPIFALLAGKGVLVLINGLQYYVRSIGVRISIFAVVVLISFLYVGNAVYSGLTNGYFWKTYVTGGYSAANFRYRDADTYRYLQYYSEVVSADSILISDIITPAYFAAYLPNHQIYSLSILIAQQQSYVPPGVVMPSLETNKSEIVDLLNAQVEVYYIGLREPFEQNIANHVFSLVPASDQIPLYHVQQVE